MVDAWVTVSRGRSLKEDKLWTALTFFNGAPEHILLTPHLKDVVVHLRQIQAIMLGKFLRHIYLFSFIKIRLSIYRVQRY
jgi:hypothetical protein